jgi:hypothetical protein
MSKPRKKPIHGNGASALTPMIPPANDELERQAMLGILESRANAQQKRIADLERFIAVLKRESVQQRKAIADVRQAYFQSIALKPNTEKK